MTASDVAGFDLARPVRAGWWRPPRLSWRDLGAGVLAVAVALAGLLVVATGVHLEVPAPTGPHAVGRRTLSWQDASRAELRTPEDDRRTVPAHVWYPAVDGTGRRADYVDGLSVIADGLAASGEVPAVAVRGLRYVRDHARAGAQVAAAGPWPVVLLSPGNATNVAFYAALAEELASAGFVVVGVDHPYQVAAVAVDGGVATYDATADRLPAEQADDAVAAKISERVADLTFALDRMSTLAADAAPGGDDAWLAGHVDLTRIAVIGHSNGGIAAMELCRRDPRILACANLDGQSAGGPFSTSPEVGPPRQPTLVVTKERSVHPVIEERYEEAGALRVVVPAAAHDHFADAALFRPTLNPFARTQDRVITVTRGFVRAFLEMHLVGAPASRLGEVDAPTDVYVNIHPLGGRPSLPAGDAGGR